MITLIPAASYAIDPYYQDFEGLVQSDPDALGNDGWLVYGNVFAPDTTYMYGYGAYPAPNHSLAFSQIVDGESGEEQGLQVLSVFSDYENLDHGSGNLIESNVYQEQTIGAGDVGTTWCFKFQHKRGNIEGTFTAQAFIKTLDPDNGYATTNHFQVDMTSIPDTWGGDSLTIAIDASLENQILQIGFSNLGTNYEGSGIFYDNVAFDQCSGSSTGLDPYAQTFEELIHTDPDALANDDWLVFGNVFTPENELLYSYGPFAAPNHNLAFCQIVQGESGEEQGLQVLSVFSDYENLDHANGNLVESIVYREQVIGASDVGSVWCFKFQHKRGNIEGSSTANAFIKTLDPNNGYMMTNYIVVDMTTVPDTWGGDSLMIGIDASLENQLLQIGFSNIATEYEGSGIFYDNLVLEVTPGVGVPESQELAFARLSQNVPNPFALTTRIDFSLERPSHLELSVFDVSGRQVATLSKGTFGVGSHRVIWDGLTTSGSPAPSGVYWYVLKTDAGDISDRMILTR